MIVRIEGIIGWVWLVGLSYWVSYLGEGGDKSVGAGVRVCGPVAGWRGVVDFALVRGCVS